MTKLFFIGIFWIGLSILLQAQPRSLDSSFGNNGFTVWDNNGNTDAFYDMVRSSEGKIFLSGYTANANNETPAVIQVDASGQLNNAFGNEGMVAIEPTATDGETEDMAIFRENIYIAYYAMIDDDFSGAITKYDLTGKLDTTFGEQGKKTIFYNDQSYTPRAITIDNQENVYILANRGGQFVVTKMNKNGMMDQSFGDMGAFFHKFDRGFANVEDISLQADSLILVTGQNFISSATNPEAPLVVFRLDPTGNLDETFNQNGQKTIALGEEVRLNAYKVFWSEQEEKLLIIGSYYTDNHDGLVIRLNTDGSNDDTFGNNGVVLIEEVRQPLYGGFRDLEGRYVVVGDDYIIRLTTNGEKDMSFGTNGIVSDQYNIYATEMDATGNYLVAGSSYNGNDLDGFVAKYRAEDISSSTEDYYQSLLPIQLSPNPFVDNINLFINNNENLSSALIVIQTVGGQVVYRSATQDLKPGINQIPIHNRISSLKPQNYVLSIITDRGVTSRKIAKF